MLLMPRRQAWLICPCLVVALPRWISACLLAQSRPKNNPAKRAGKFEWREIQMDTRHAGRSHSLIGNSLIVSDRARPRHDNRPQLELLAAASRSARWCLCCPNVHTGAHHTLHVLFLTKPSESHPRLAF